MREYLVIEEESIPHIRLCTIPSSNSFLFFTKLSLRNGLGLRYIEITQDSLLFSVAQAIFLLSSERLSRSTLHLIEGGEGSLYTPVLCGLATVLSCIGPSVRNATKSPEVGSLHTYILHLSGLGWATGACPRFWPDTTRPAPSSPGQSGAANHVLPPQRSVSNCLVTKWSNS